jgi:chaperonin GroES
MKVIKPLNDRVVVKDESKETGKKTESGLYIPESVTEEGEHQIGDVLEVGHGKYNDKGELIRKLNVSKGDKVIYGKYAGVHAVLNGESVRLMIEDDILGTVIDE